MKTALFITTEVDTFRIELFEDEDISINSSIQNVNDISKVFTDYTQTFTIPASNHNNKVFKHWYENTLDLGFDQRINHDGYIEIDTQLFRKGKWRLEGARVDHGTPTDYRITFFGVIKSLTDKFGEDKLRDLLELDAYPPLYDSTYILAGLTSEAYRDVYFPLISSKRVWQISGAENILSAFNPIKYTELFPALRIQKIFEAIEAKYLVLFNGYFLAQSRFTEAFLWMKNADEFKATSVAVRADLKRVNNSGSGVFPIDFDLTNDTWVWTPNPLAVSVTHRVKVTFSTETTYSVSIFKNGILYTTATGTGLVSANINLPKDELAEYYVEISASTNVDYEITVTGSADTANTVAIGNGTVILYLSLTALAPDMKISDFFSGILKMFNLTAISEDGISFQLEQLEQWYTKGDIKDFTEFCEPMHEVEKVKTYNNINLEYQDSASVLNSAYEEINGIKHGNLTYNLGNDGSDYSIKLPFENLLFTKFTGTSIAVSYALNKELKPYIPKPVILYKKENVSTSFYFNNGNTTTEITKYNVFGQDVDYENEVHSMNFGIEVSPYLSEVVDNTLFSDYYLAYLRNIFELKSRLIKIKMRLSFSALISLKLNDRIIVRDKRYIINAYTTNLNTFESSFELIEDLRKIEVVESDLILRADWGAIGITDEASFSAYTNITEITNFNITGDLVGFKVNESQTILGFEFLGITEVVKMNSQIFNEISFAENLLTFFNPIGDCPNLYLLNLNNNNITSFTTSNSYPLLWYLYLSENNLSTFTPIGDMKAINFLDLTSNQMTLASYSAMETFANTLNVGSGNFYFENNANSVIGTNLQTILISKGKTVV